MTNALNRPIRVLIAKVGLDGHERRSKIIASSLRNGGMEVINTGLPPTPETVVNATLQEYVGAIGISILSDARVTVFPHIFYLMKEKQMDDVLLTYGSIIQEEHIETLQQIGVSKLFTPVTKIADYIQQ